MKIRVENKYSHWWYLYVNDVWIGTSLDPKNYEHPEEWAKRQLKKRLAVIDRNIHRLGKEIHEWGTEKDKLLQ